MKEKNKTDRISLHMVRDTSSANHRTEDWLPQTVETLIRPLISCQNRDCTGILCIDAAGRPVNVSLVSTGTVAGTVRTLREIMKAALMNNAHQMVLFHSHCGGSSSPTRSERLIAARVEQAAALLEMMLLDHFIIVSDTNAVDRISRMEIVNTDTMVSGLDKTS